MLKAQGSLTDCCQGLPYADMQHTCMTCLITISIIAIIIIIMTTTTTIIIMMLEAVVLLCRQP